MNQSAKLNGLKGLWSGVAVLCAMLLLGAWQQIMPPAAWNTAAVALLMATWWATEALPVPVTALVPIIAFPLLGVADVNAAVAPYAHPTIYLFLAAFLLALAVEKSGLHRRIALAILARTGTEGRRLVGGFMLTTAGLSMWLNNTSTTMMMLPIAMSVIAVVIQNVGPLSERQETHFRTAVLLGLAYAASIGGVGTLIGTPPNLLLAGFLEQNYGLQISFIDWLFVGIPVVVLALPLAWWVLTRIAYQVDIPATDSTREHLHTLQAELGEMNLAQRRVAVVFGLVVGGWVSRAPLQQWFGLDGVSDTGIALIGALSLFVLGDGGEKPAKLLAWDDTSRLPWGVLLLFGGGLSLAAAISSSGLALWLGQSVSGLSVHGIFVLTLAAITLMIFLTEMTSNLATTATFLPVIGAIALQAGVSPLLLCVPITLAASFAFMLPVATPPNAIVYSSNLITIPQMVRAGLVLNLAGIVLLIVVGTWWAPLALGY